MNLEEILKDVQAQLDIASDNIDWADDEVLAQIRLVNSAIRTWASSNNTRWDELFTIVETEPLHEGRNEFEIGSDFILLDSVAFSDSGQMVEVRNIRNSQAPGNYVVASGDRFSGYKLKFNKDIEAGDNMIGRKLKIFYYRTAKELSDPEDTAEMSDPSFIVDYVTAMVASDDDANKFSIFASNYAQKLKNMVERNNQIAQYQDDSALYDSDLSVGV